MSYIDSHAIKKWFNQSKRDLPWRSAPSPYAVWVSEIMLQQTQVATVIPYYLKWMVRFPSIEALANATEEEVVKHWEGLGYYSRARSLLKGAQYIMKNLEGEIPKTRAELEKVPGIGPYTAGAVLSFAFHLKGEALDGNVMRVLSRAYGIAEDITKAKTKSAMHQILSDLLDCDEPWVVMEGLIELGALVCQKDPKCHSCPLQKSCIGLKRGIERTLPVKREKKRVIQLHRHTICLIHSGSILLRQEDSKLMKGLWHFPYWETPSEMVVQDEIQQYIRVTWGHESTFIDSFKEIQHGFTRYRATLYPTVWRAHSRAQVSGYQWINIDALNDLPFPSGHRELKNQIIQWESKGELICKDLS